MSKNIIIQCMQGLGDNIYARPFVEAACKQKSEQIFVKTPWPQLFWDIVENHGVKLLKWDSHLRVQSKNEDRFGVDVFSPTPCCSENIHMGYNRADLRDGLGLIGSMATQNDFEIDDGFSFRPRPEWVAAAREITDRPFALIKPPTLRTDWHNSSRNPCPQAFQSAVDELGKTHFLVSLADLQRNKEWLAHPIEGIDLELHDGTIPLETVLGLCSLADVLLTAPGFFIPLGIALHVRTFCIFGGYHRPTDVIDGCMTLDRYASVAPDPFCACFQQSHDCNKHIDQGVMIESLNRLMQETLKDERQLA